MLALPSFLRPITSHSHSTFRLAPFPPLLCRSDSLQGVLAASGQRVGVSQGEFGSGGLWGLRDLGVASLMLADSYLAGNALISASYAL